jgi:hypothetical protein
MCWSNDASGISGANICHPWSFDPEIPVVSFFFTFTH